MRGLKGPLLRFGKNSLNAIAFLNSVQYVCTVINTNSVQKWELLKEKKEKEKRLKT